MNPYWLSRPMRNPRFFSLQTILKSSMTMVVPIAKELGGEGGVKEGEVWARGGVGG